MKSVIYASIIFILIIILVITSYMYTENVTSDFLYSISRAEGFVAKEQWQSAKYEINKSIDSWQGKRDIMEVFVDHSVVDEVDYSLSKLKSAVSLEEKSDFLEESGKTVLLLTGLMEQQKISISNLF